MATIVEKAVCGMIGWVTFSWLLVLLAERNRLEILATLLTIGLLISAELLSGYATRTVRDKVSTFAYSGFLVFIAVVILRVRQILLQ